MQPEAVASSGVHVLVGLLAALFTLCRLQRVLQGEWRDVWVPSLFQNVQQASSTTLLLQKPGDHPGRQDNNPLPKTSTPCPESREHLTSHVDSNWARVTKPRSRDGEGAGYSRGHFRHGVFVRGAGGSESGRDWEGLWCSLCRGREGPGASRSWQRQDQILPWSPHEGVALPTAAFQTSDLHHCRIKKQVLFSARACGCFSSSHGKLTSLIFFDP